MSRLIEEDAAVERISNAIWHLPNDMYPRFNSFDTIHAVVKDAVNGVPSAQPEIVRCENCGWWQKEWPADDMGRHYCTMVDDRTDREFYCANAERR